MYQIFSIMVQFIILSQIPVFVKDKNGNFLVFWKILYILIHFDIIYNEKTYDRAARAGARIKTYLRRNIMPTFNAEFKMDVIPVTKEFIENYMPSANGAYVKVFLYALFLGYEKTNMSNSQIARVLNLLESDVVNALKFWQEEGLLTLGDDTVTFKGAAPLKAAPKTEVKKHEIKEPPKISSRDITEEMTDNKELSELCTIAQEIFERPLKKREIETLYWFYDELELSPEVITMLLEYCVSKDKRNMNYIEKVAISWHKNGIMTIEAANKFITSEMESGSYLGSMKKLFGFGDRNLTKTEETYLKSWRDDFGMNEEMVSLAYEYCLDAIHNLSFPYIDTIIKRWSELGILTPDAAKKDHEDFKSKKNKKDFDVFDNTKTDYDEIEKIIQDKMK